MELNPETESYYVLQGLKAGYFDWFEVRDLLFSLREDAEDAVNKIREKSIKKHGRGIRGKEG